VGADAAYEQFKPVAVTTRSGFDESVHFGAVVALDRDGSVAAFVGGIELPIFGRSVIKPMQADAMCRTGLRLPLRQLAIACSSHDGSPLHTGIVREILNDAGLGIEALQNTPSLPSGAAAFSAHAASGSSPSAVLMNCSGKHAAMVATCIANEWDLATYLNPGHPLQRLISSRIEELAGPVVGVGVDGCGAPAPVLPLVGLARGLRTLALTRSDVWQAMTTFPDLVGGPTRHVSRIMRLVPELMAKDGAEGVFAAALPDGRAAAVKISDGSSRAAGVVLGAALNQIGVDIDPGQLSESILGHGLPVGQINPVIKGAWQVV
jgi:L-asparaginase II